MTIFLQTSTLFLQVSSPTLCHTNTLSGCMNVRTIPLPRSPTLPARIPPCTEAAWTLRGRCVEAECSCMEAAFGRREGCMGAACGWREGCVGRRRGEWRWHGGCMGAAWRRRGEAWTRRIGGVEAECSGSTAAWGRRGTKSTLACN